MNNNETIIETVKLPRTIEASLEIIIKLIGLYLVYKFGIVIMDDADSNNTLFSILLLPALLVLKNAHVIVEPFTIKASMTEYSVTVTSGFLTRKTDKLSIDTLENIELVKTPLGQFKSPLWGNYGTLNLYAYGGTVVMPYLKSPENVQKEIEIIMQEKFNLKKVVNKQ